MKMTTLEISIHPENENPVFGNGSTLIRMDDDGAGSYLVIKQETDDYGSNEIRLDFEEVEKLVEAVNILKKGRVK